MMMLSLQRVTLLASRRTTMRACTIMERSFYSAPTEEAGHAFENEKEKKKPQHPSPAQVAAEKVDIVHEADANEFAKAATPDKMKNAKLHIFE
jgi:hypothetical protein